MKPQTVAVLIYCLLGTSHCVIGGPARANHSAEATVAAISGTRVFEEPLLAIGERPTPAQNGALATAIRSYSKRQAPDDFSSLTQFLAEHPRSPWNGSLLTGLGLEYYNSAHYSKAVEAWSRAWELVKDAKDQKGKAVADRAAGELAYMYARLGRMQELDGLLKSVEGRTFIGPATEKISGAREALWNMQNRPEISFRCGPLALHRIKAMVAPSHAADMAIFESASTQKGMSLPQVAEISRTIGLNYQIAYREKGAAFVVPAVVHWKAGHYAAMTRRDGARYLLQDPTFGNDVWATTNALESEASGYFLVPPGPLPKGWRAVHEVEGEKIWGKGVTSNNDPKPHTPDDPSTPREPCKGMATPSVHLMLVSLNVSDEPVGYSPPVGPAVRFTVRYNHREAFQPATFTYANFGPKWTCDWLAYITDNPQSPSGDVNFYVRGGGTRTFTGFDTNTQRFAQQQYDQSRLTRSGPDSYESVARDGSRMIFSRSDGATGTSRKIFLTQIVDAYGNTVTLHYDGNLRLTNIVDAIGQGTTLTYGNTNDVYKITRVTDPFGRFASFEYDSLGRLTNITDVVGIQSRFLYEGTSDFINALVTPYGTTSFTRGGGGTTRWLETLYPDGSRERVEFNQASNLGVPFSEPAGLVPQEMSTFNQWLYARNTYYWSRTASATAHGDYSKAKIYHWLHTLDLSTTAGILESIKEPLEGRVWFDYPGQSAPLFVGSINKPRHVGRVLDDSTTQLYRYEYNEFGKVTNSIDPLGRTFSYVYASNGIDLLEVRMTRAGKNELLRRATYNAQHLPLTITDAAGQTTTNTYNSRGQLLATTNPKGDTTAFSYDAKGYLVAIDGPLPGTNDIVTATYDAFGRARTKTDASGYTITLSYDALDRIRTIIYPDATSEQITYNRLDPAVLSDRAGRLTSLEYNPLRQLVKRTDPLGRVTHFQWCNCGDIKTLADSLGRTTEWQTDVQGRLVAKQYGDGSKVSYFYENLSGRPRQIVDEKQQIKQFAYNRDNTLRSINYLDTTVPTPTVSYQYDPDYERVVAMTDGTGTTSYSFVPITGTSTPGAGQVSSVDGPLPNDTITYSYDELGRRAAIAINGAAATRTYDAAGRVSAFTNLLGAFTYTYDGSSSRVLSETFPNGQVTTRAYEPNTGDRMLQQLSHQVGATLLSEFSYGRDNTRGVITTWSQQMGSAAPDVYNFGYDAADQLQQVTVTNGGVLLKSFDYVYDAAGNRLLEVASGTTNQAAYNALNQVSASSGPGAARTLEWDGEDRLRAVTAGTERTEFSYDGVGRLANLRLLTNGVEASFRRLVWRDNRIAEERDATGAVTKRFFDQGIRIESGPNAGTYFYTRDHLGSIREVTDAAGTVRARYSYDPFGRRTRVFGDIDADFGFTGLFSSWEARVAVARYRVYDPELGRWLSRDPLKGAEIREGPNLYAYVQNNPINAVDRLGLCCEKEKQALDDMIELVETACQYEFDQADRNCALIALHPADPWSFTCGDAQKFASRKCEEIERKYYNSLVNLAADYFVCLAIGCRQPPPCNQTPDDDLCPFGVCTISSGKPAERMAAESRHNEMY